MSTPDATRRFKPLRALAVAGMFLALLPGTALAKGHAAPAAVTSSANCSVSPGVVPAGSLYTMTGSGYAPNEVLEEWINGGLGTVITFGGADANGNMMAQAYAYYTGSYTVSVKDVNSGAILATCGFSV